MAIDSEEEDMLNVIDKFSEMEFIIIQNVIQHNQYKEYFEKLKTIVEDYYKHRLIKL
jgi:hypothetical protein